MNQMQLSLLKTICNALLASNKQVSSKELKDEVHSLGANVHFDNGVFSQFMASSFLKTYFEENVASLERELKTENNVMYYIYKSKTDGLLQTVPTPNVVNKPNVVLNPTISGAVICYNRNNPLEFVQAPTRKEARTEVRRKYNIENADHINTCSLKYFTEKYLTQK